MSTGTYMEEEDQTHGIVPNAQDADVQMRLCCSDLQSMEVFDTEASGVLIAGTLYHHGDDGNKEKDSPKGFGERVDSLHGRSRSDDLTPSNFDVQEQPPSNTLPAEYCHGFDDKVDIWVSSLDLDEEEDMEWDKDGSDGLGLDFPSPSHRMLHNLRVRSPKLISPSFRQLFDVQSALGSSPSSSLLELSLKRAAGADSPRTTTPRADEPLFWPFDWKSYWRPEFDGNYLGISPRTGILGVKRPRVELGFGGVLQQRNRNNIRSTHPNSLHRENTKQGTGSKSSRFLTASSSTRSEKKPTLATKKKARAPNNYQAPHATMRVRSRLSRSSKSSSSEKTTGINGSKKEGKDRHPRVGSGNKRRRSDQSCTTIQYLMEFETGDRFQVYVGGEIPIEALLGLDEFDGHEGVGMMMMAS